MFSSHIKQLLQLELLFSFVNDQYCEGSAVEIKHLICHLTKRTNEIVYLRQDIKYLKTVPGLVSDLSTSGYPC